MKKSNFYLAIGQEGTDTMMKQSFEIPPSYWERWFTVSFQFRHSNNKNQHAVANVSVVGNMIWVKERWFHKVWNWIYFKIKKPEARQG